MSAAGTPAAARSEHLASLIAVPAEAMLPCRALALRVGWASVAGQSMLLLLVVPLLMMTVVVAMHVQSYVHERAPFGPSCVLLRVGRHRTCVYVRDLACPLRGRFSGCVCSHACPFS